MLPLSFDVKLIISQLSSRFGFSISCKNNKLPQYSPVTDCYPLLKFIKDKFETLLNVLPEPIISNLDVLNYLYFIKVVLYSICIR